MSTVVLSDEALQPRRQGMLGTRAIGLLAVATATVAFIAYMVRTVPVDAPRLPRAEAFGHWPAALNAALVVAGGIALVALIVVRRGGVPFGTTLSVAPTTGLHWPRAMGWQAVPRRVVLTAAGVSVGFALAAIISGHGLWFVGLSGLIPWTPLLVYEVVWKRERYGLFAIFLAVSFIQCLHMGEHSVQTLQMLITRGDLAHSHGVFGQLDFETVHFVFDTLLWFALGTFLVLFRGANRWLWVAFVAASLHQIEHFYLFWMYLSDRATYAAGGFAGIMGSGGVIGSPLGRPYLHFSYNMIVIVPMLVALWDQARSVDASELRSRR
ncbi:MAG: hypothetical protein ACT4PI_06600 [Actinomycetota bacterium]